jgi:hypothetical protein
MDWNAVGLLRKNSKGLAKTLGDYVRENHPARTYEFKKCNRDLQFLIQAISSSIQANNTAPIDHLIRVFYRGDRLQLKTIDVELEVYDMLEKNILKLFDENDIPQESKNMVSVCIDIMKTGLENGPIHINSDWAERRNYKKYDPDIVIPYNMQEHIETSLQNAPMQTSGYSKFSIIKLLPSDVEIKEFITKNYFWNDNTGFYEVAVITAPIVYLFMPDADDGLEQFDMDGWAWFTKYFHMGIHGGAVLDYVITQGYNFSFIGCTTEPGDSTTDKQWRKLLSKRFNYKTNDDYPWPIMALCIGKGIDNTGSAKDKYVTQSGDVLPYIAMSPKWAQRKHNIIFY